MLRWSTSDTTRIDPTIDFRFRSFQEIYPESELKAAWWLVVLELRDISINELAERAAEKGLELRVAPFHDEAARERTAETQYVSVYASHDFIDAANKRGNPFSVERMSVGGMVPEGRLAEEAPPPATKRTKVPKGSVITAVIDSGIAFAHELFRLPDNTTRVHGAWVMDAHPPQPGIQGRRYGKEDIDRLLAKHTRAGLLDEDAFYREVGLIDFGQPGFKPASLRRSHGTHVMGLAAGFRPGENATTRPIICVDLPADEVRDVTGARLNVPLTAALDFVLDCASRIEIEGEPGEQPPLVINFSFGNFAGPHDGTGVIERTLDRALDPARAAGTSHPGSHPGIRREMTLPAGNGNLSRCHAEIRFEADGETATLDWRVQPDDHSESFVQLWMPPRKTGPVEDLVAVTVEPPGGPESGAVGARFGGREVLRQNGDQVGEISFVWVPVTGRGVMNLCIKPTASLNRQTSLAPSGLWKIRVANVGLRRNEAVQVWIRRDETLPGFPLFGRQSYFDNECYRRFDSMGRRLAVDPKSDPCIVRRDGTVSGFSCGERPSVIAGFIASSKEMAEYSAAGPITKKASAASVHRDGPDAAARSDDSVVARGVLSAGSRSGSMLAVSGTSVAAPQVAFWIADELAAGKPGNRKGVRGRAARDEATIPPHPVRGRPSEFRRGEGRMLLERRLGSKRRDDDLKGGS